MVRIGEFSVRLVDAETKIPFKEHTASDGKTYAEVEPNQEYFIAVKQTTGKKVVFEFEVDGNDLGYISWSAGNKGLFTRDDSGKQSHRALQVKKPGLSNSMLEQQKKSTPSLGNVSVSFYEAICRGIKEPKTIEGAGLSAEVDNVSSLKKKVLRSGEGSSVITKKSLTTPYVSFKKGKLLQTITIHYCTAICLIHLGVLPKPQAAKKSQKRETSNQLPVEPKRIKRDAIIDKTSGQVLMPEVEYDLFDLTELPSDDELPCKKESDSEGECRLM